MATTRKSAFISHGLTYPSMGAIVPSQRPQNQGLPNYKPARFRHSGECGYP